MQVIVLLCLDAACTANETPPEEPSLGDPKEIADPSVVRTKISNLHPYALACFTGGS